MPNTRPVNDCGAVTRFIVERARPMGRQRVSDRRRDEGAEEMGFRISGSLSEADAWPCPDDGRPIVSPAVMRRVLEYSRIFDIPVVNHCEDLGLSAGGVMNEGKTASALGLRGIPGASEEIMARRDIALAELTGPVSTSPT
jgi:dihydroorotase